MHHHVPHVPVHCHTGSAAGHTGELHSLGTASHTARVVLARTDARPRSVTRGISASQYREDRTSGRVGHVRDPDAPPMALLLPHLPDLAAEKRHVGPYVEASRAWVVP